MATSALRELHLLRVYATALGIDPDGVTGLRPIAPHVLPDVVFSSLQRERLVHALRAVVFVYGRVSESELLSLEQFADALEISDPHLKNLRQILGGHYLMLRLDLVRRGVLAISILRGWISAGYGHPQRGVDTEKA